MALPYISVEDCFPVIRQTILDTYKVDSFLMHYPYSDLERLDMGLRKMVWGTYSTNSAIFSLSPEQDAWQIIVLKSVLGFYNLIITVTSEEHPDMFGFMPFRTEPATPAVINRIMKENGIPGRNEICNLSVRITGDILQGSRTLRLLIQPLNRHNRKYLINRPRVGQGLEQ